MSYISKGLSLPLTSEKPAQISRWVRQLVLLIVSILQRDEDAQVVCASNYSHACAGEFRAQLVVTLGTNALLRAVDVEGGDGRVMRGLFGKI